MRSCRACTGVAVTAAAAAAAAAAGAAGSAGGAAGGADAPRGLALLLLLLLMNPAVWMLLGRELLRIPAAAGAAAVPPSTEAAAGGGALVPAEASALLPVLAPVDEGTKAAPGLLLPRPPAATAAGGLRVRKEALGAGAPLAVTWPPAPALPAAAAPPVAAAAAVGAAAGRVLVLCAAGAASSRPDMPGWVPLLLPAGAPCAGASLRAAVPAAGGFRLEACWWRAAVGLAAPAEEGGPDVAAAAAAVCPSAGRGVTEARGFLTCCAELASLLAPGAAAAG